MPNEPLLTICIPTFNRPQQLLKCLDALAPQLVDGVQLWIFDNASDVAAQEAIAPHLSNPRIVVHRNRENVGCVANIMKAIEMPSTPWVWVIGDDDDVRPDAIRLMMSAIASAPAETGAIHFVSVFSEKTDLEAVPQTLTLESFLSRRGALNELSFLGQFAMRREAISAYIKYGYHFAYSCFPHTVVLLMTLGSGHTIWMWPHTIHDLPDRTLERSDHYRAFPSVLGAPTLAELPLASDLRKQLVLLLGEFTTRSLRSVVFDGLVRMKQPELRFEAQLLLAQVNARVTVLNPTLRERGVLKTAMALQGAPRVAYAIARSLYKSAKGSIDESRFMRPVHSRLL